MRLATPELRKKRIFRRRREGKKEEEGEGKRKEKKAKKQEEGERRETGTLCSKFPLFLGSFCLLKDGFWAKGETKRRNREAKAKRDQWAKKET